MNTRRDCIIENEPNNTNQDSLRQRAEAALRKSGADIEQLPPKDLRTLVQELQVHQIELKMQNEELRNTQLQLQGSRDSYTELYELAPVGYLTLDSGGVIRTANLTASTLFGTNRSDLIDTKMATHVAADDQDRLHHAFRHLRESHEKQAFELGILNQGQPIWTLVVASSRQSNPDAFLVTLSDISLRKRAEAELTQLNQMLEQRVEQRSEQLTHEKQALRLSEERLSLGFRASRDAIWDWDLKAGTVWWNEAFDKLFGKRPAEANSTQFWIDHIHSDDRERVTDALTVAQASGPEYGNFWNADYRFQRQDGSYAHVNDRAIISRNVDGKATRILGTVRDVTQRVAAEEERLQSERLAAIGEAMAGLVHESRNALNRSVSALRMIERRTKDKPELDEYIDGAREALHDIQKLFEEVRQYAAPVKVNPQPCKLVEVVDKSWERLLLLREKREARVIHCGDLNSECHACDVTISQVFRNILENALSACSDPVEIEVQYSCSALNGKPAIRIAVCDNGPGLPPEARDRVFDAFYTTRTHGTGLGLAICKRIVEAHGGRIEAGESNGSGAEFIVTLPIDQ